MDQGDIPDMLLSQIAEMMECEAKAPDISHMDFLYDEITGAWGMDFVSSSPLFSTTPPLFRNFHINHSFFKICIIIRFFHLTISVDVIHHE